MGQKKGSPCMTTPVYPSALQELRQGQQWVCYDKNKIPYTPTSGKRAKANDPVTWATSEQAQKAFRASKTRYAGVGREFIKEQGITGIDLDKCIDEHGQLSPFAKEIVARLNSYTEYSPSGKGLHIWVHGSLPENLGPDPDGNTPIEMYDCDRYFTWTGKRMEGTPKTIEARQEQLDMLYQETVAARRQVKEAKRKPRALPTIKSLDTPYGLAALEKECQDVAASVQGARNHQLNSSAYRLGQLIAGDELSRSTVERELLSAADRAGLGYHEAERTMRSGIEAGMQEPRKAPAREWQPYEPEAMPRVHSNGYHSATVDLCSFDADDSGNGDAMCALFGQDFLWCGTRGWFTYTGTHWELDGDGAKVHRRAVETLRRRRHAAVDAEREFIIKCTKADNSRVTGCINRFKTLVSVSIDEFDNDPDMLNCKNGVLDTRDGTLKPHSRQQRFTYCLPVEYEPSDYSEWLDYLNGVVGGGQEVIDYLQMACGYSLTGHTREEILFYLYGPTRSGKGTFAEVFMALLPRPISTTVDFNSFTAKREGDVSNFDLAPLKPSRMIFASESNRGQSLNPAKIKQLTGGDYVRACFKHKDFFDYRPQFKVWMMSNHPVNGDPEDDALWGRVRVIEFPNSFLGIEDKGKKARLKDPEVLKGVLYWAMQGAIAWYGLGSKGLDIPAAVIETTQAQRDELDLVQQWLEECCDLENGGWASNEEIMASYTEWCKDNNVQYPKGPKALAQSLKAKGYEVSKPQWVNGKTKRGVGGLHIYGK